MWTPSLPASRKWTPATCSRRIAILRTPRWISTATDGWLDVNTTYTYGIVHRMLLARLQPHARHAVRPDRNDLRGRAQRFGGSDPPPGLLGIVVRRHRPVHGEPPDLALRSGLAGSAWTPPAPKTWSGSRLCSLRDRGMNCPGPKKHEVVVDGLGEFRGLDYLAAARTADGGTVIAYLPTSRTIHRRLEQSGGNVGPSMVVQPANGESRMRPENSQPAQNSSSLRRARGLGAGGR